MSKLLLKSDMGLEEAAKLLAVAGLACTETSGHALTGKCARVEAGRSLLADRYGRFVFLTHALCNAEIMGFVALLMTDAEGRCITREAVQADVDAMTMSMFSVNTPVPADGSLSNMRDEMQAQIGATSDKIERGLLVDALSSIEEAKESDVKKVGSVVSDRQPLFKVGDKVSHRYFKEDLTVVEMRCNDGRFTYICDEGRRLVDEADIELQTPRVQ